MGSAHHTRSPASALDDVREALQSAGHSIRPRGSDAFMASCPLHSDHSPSLSVTWRESTQAGRSGAVLLHCFSCQAAAGDIAAALGMRLADLFDNPVPPVGPCAPVQQRQRATQGKLTRRAGTRGPLPARITLTRDQADHVWRRVRVYTYTSLAGTPVQQVIRQECSCNSRTSGSSSATATAANGCTASPKASPRCCTAHRDAHRGSNRRMDMDHRR
jgi:hypothetical protein